MAKRNLSVPLVVILIGAIFVSGCVERRLTINTEPQGAVVVLNDEEIGTSPVTVGFNWYGDYNVRIQKQGYQTLKTHRELKGPWYDKFPFDFFAGVLSSKQILDKYEWTFEMQELELLSREELIKNAEKLKSQL